MHLWRLVVTTLVASNAVQRVDIDKEHIAIAIDELYRLVHLATLLNLDQTSKAAYTVVDMGDIVAHLQRVQLGNGHLLIALDLTIYLVSAVSFEESMLGIERNPEIVVGEAVVQGEACHLELCTLAPCGVKQPLKTLRLGSVLR